jgi:hypothetical protein
MSRPDDRLWDETGKKITFIRVINATDPSTNQVYTGFHFNNQRGQPTDVSHTITGFFDAFEGTGGVAERLLYGWVAAITVLGNTGHACPQVNGG